MPGKKVKDVGGRFLLEDRKGEMVELGWPFGARGVFAFGEAGDFCVAKGTSGTRAEAMEDVVVMVICSCNNCKESQVQDIQ